MIVSGDSWSWLTGIELNSGSTMKVDNGDYAWLIIVAVSYQLAKWWFMFALWLAIMAIGRLMIDDIE